MLNYLTCECLLSVGIITERGSRAVELGVASGVGLFEVEGVDRFLGGCEESRLPDEVADCGDAPRGAVRYFNKTGVDSAAVRRTKGSTDVLMFGKTLVETLDSNTEELLDVFIPFSSEPGYFLFTDVLLVMLGQLLPTPESPDTIDSVSQPCPDRIDGSEG